MTLQGIKLQQKVPAYLLSIHRFQQLKNYILGKNIYIRIQYELDSKTKFIYFCRCMANAKKIDKLPGPDTNTSVTPLRADTPNKDQFKCVNELPTVVDKVQL